MINGKVVQSYMDGSIQLKLVGLDKTESLYQEQVKLI